MESSETHSLLPRIEKGLKSMAYQCLKTCVECKLYSRTSTFPFQTLSSTCAFQVVEACCLLRVRADVTVCWAVEGAAECEPRTIAASHSITSKLIGP